VPRAAIGSRSGIAFSLPYFLEPRGRRAIVSLVCEGHHKLQNPKTD